MRLDISRTTGNGYALRLRFSATLTGPCMRCLGPAAPSFDIDAREVNQPGAGDEDLSSPYVDGDDDLDLAAWARDAFALAVPAQITCMPDCRGLCPECGANLNDDPEHAHEAEPDPRWAKLSEIRFDCRARYPSGRPWPSPSRSSRTLAPTSAGRSTRSPRRS